MSRNPFDNIFTPEVLSGILPRDTADRFFEALFGDPSEGAYDIFLVYRGHKGERLFFDLELRQRPGKCLACHLTYGLPQVFSRHPVLDLKGLVERICGLLKGEGRCNGWSLGSTKEVRRDLHVIPLVLSIEKEDL